MRTSSRSVSHLVVWLVPALLCYAGEAKATDATEFPDNGSEQSGRGGAWVARASDPLATFYNPAGLAGQPTRLVLQSNFGSQHTCFSRIKAKNDTTNDGVMPGGAYPQICNGAGYGVDPQLAMTIRLSKRVGLGIAPLMAPSSAGGMASYQEFATVGGVPNSPAPERYLLTAQNVLLITPTIGIGAEIIDRLRIGASFQWGIATFSFTSASATENMDNAVPGTVGPPPSGNDLLAKLSGHDYFIPGFTLGTIYSPTDMIDIAGWYKWSGPVAASGDVQTQYPYFADKAAGMPNATANTDTSQPNCGFEKTTTPCGSGGNANIHLSRPMEAKLGFRFHLPRKNVPYDEHARDPMAQDVFDAEIDGTWANNSAMDLFYINFPSAPDAGGTLKGTLPVNLGSAGQSVVPPNADIPLHYTDVFGIRVGGDWNVLPDQFTLRGGAFYQSAAQTQQQYQSLAFAAGSMIGLALGATYRIHFGPGSNALEISGGYEHVFVGTESTTDGQGFGLAGTPCDPAPLKNGQCPGGAQRYRTPWAVNDGTITNAINVINAGIGYRF
jgi:long-subunit fatty acid transport protein